MQCCYTGSKGANDFLVCGYYGISRAKREGEKGRRGKGTKAGKKAQRHRARGEEKYGKAGCRIKCGMTNQATPGKTQG